MSFEILKVCIRKLINFHSVWWLNNTIFNLCYLKHTSTWLTNRWTTFRSLLAVAISTTLVNFNSCFSLNWRIFTGERSPCNTNNNQLKTTMAILPQATLNTLFVCFAHRNTAYLSMVKLLIVYITNWSWLIYNHTRIYKPLPMRLEQVEFGGNSAAPNGSFLLRERVDCAFSLEDA